MSGLETAMAGASAAGTLLGGYGEYRSGMDQRGGDRRLASV